MKRRVAGLGIHESECGTTVVGFFGSDTKKQTKNPLFAMTSMVSRKELRVGGQSMANYQVSL